MPVFARIREFVLTNRFLYAAMSPLIHWYLYAFKFYQRNKRFKNNGEEVLKQAHDALRSINLHFWLDFGTLLGAVRDHALLKNDLDVDLGVFLHDYSPAIEQAMRKYGFQLIKEYTIDQKAYGLEQTYEYKGVTVDLFYYGEDGSRMWSHVFVNFPGMTDQESIRQKGGLLPVEQYFPKVDFVPFVFLGKTFRIPSPPEKYLAYHYGEDFRIPRRWDYRDLENDNKNARYLFDKIGVVRSADY